MGFIEVALNHWMALMMLQPSGHSVKNLLVTNADVTPGISLQSGFSHRLIHSPSSLSFYPIHPFPFRLRVLISFLPHWPEPRPPGCKASTAAWSASVSLCIQQESTSRFIQHCISWNGKQRRTLLLKYNRMVFRDSSSIKTSDAVSQSRGKSLVTALWGIHLSPRLGGY